MILDMHCNILNRPWLQDCSVYSTSVVEVEVDAKQHHTYRTGNIYYCNAPFISFWDCLGVFCIALSSLQFPALAPPSANKSQDGLRLGSGQPTA